MLEIYVHIPFCRKKCGYCDFNSATPKGEETELYKKALIREIKENEHKGERVSTVFIGGGTPSLFPHEYISEIMTALRQTFIIEETAEITIEANPESVTAEGLCAYKNSGINRISMGVQSFDNRELEILGRIHRAERAEEAYGLIRETGFENVNLDLMFSYPTQTLESWEKTLRKAASLAPAHISAYSLIIEENTAFFEKYKNYQTNEDLDRIMYRKAKEILGEFGYKQYEISNFAKEGFSCRHNIGYWKRVNYLGFGLSAASLYDNVRFSNTASLFYYLKGKRVAEREVISKRDQISEFMFLGLRMTEGVSFREFYDSFGISIEEMFGDVIEKYKGFKLLDYDSERLWLTDKGIDVSNTVFADFL